MNKLIIVVGSILVIVLAFLIGGFFYKKSVVESVSNLGEANAAPFVREYSQTLGDPNAKVILVEFFDPACETCAAFYPFVKKMMSQNPGKIRLVVRYAPFHKGADYFVKILEAARKQNLYWETLETMYKTQQFWASHHNPRPELIWQFLQATKLDLDQIKTDMEDPGIAKILETDLGDADSLNVTKTPGFFVNGKPLVEFGYGNLRNLIESEVAAQYP